MTELFPNDVVPVCRCGGRPLVIRSHLDSEVAIRCSECKNGVFAASPFVALGLWGVIVDEGSYRDYSAGRPAR